MKRVSNLSQRCLPLVMLPAILVLAGGMAAAQQASASNQDCLACHSDSAMTMERSGKQISLHVDPEKFSQSIHGSMFTCVDCHTGFTGYPHPASPVMPKCSTCHADEATAYRHGVHAIAIRAGNHKAAECQDCHGNIHSILPSSDPRSATNHLNIPKTCGSCHGVAFTMSGSGVSNQPFLSYEQSVHGRAVAKGSEKAAVCTDCHGEHDIRRAGDAHSPIFKFNVPQTCGKCHGDIAAVYRKSIHGQAIARGNWEAPVCTDCHGIHNIKAPVDPNSSVSAQAIARSTCAQCHEGARLTGEFGVPGRRVATYMDSYHGMASKLGSTVVANCASCHGIHNILPPSDPNSTINKDNLAKTCGKCHLGAGPNFIRGKVHLDTQIAGSKDLGTLVIQWIRRFYLLAIFATIGFMLLHNWIVWRNKIVAHRVQPRPIVRMTPRQRWQHLALLSSFIVLALTGFALKYPDSWLAWLLGSNETVRRLGHRIAAVVLIVAGGYHLVYAIVSGEGRRLVRDLIPTRKDLSDLLDNMRYYLGLSSRRARFGRFNYGEKLEYWAVVWGTFVMGLTGFVMWFNTTAVRFIPRWSVDVATAIHFYEAVLATLAIIVWHFYSVFFDPDVYPMNWTWWDGKMSAHLYEEEHPLDLEAALVRQAEEEPANPQQEPDSRDGNEAESGDKQDAGSSGGEHD